MSSCRRFLSRYAYFKGISPPSHEEDSRQTGDSGRHEADFAFELSIASNDCFLPTAASHECAVKIPEPLAQVQANSSLEAPRPHRHAGTQVVTQSLLLSLLVELKHSILHLQKTIKMR